MTPPTRSVVPSSGRPVSTRPSTWTISCCRVVLHSRFQPPPRDTGTITGDLLVWIDGIPTAKQGVTVWAYQQNGAMLTTYSINESTYGFLPARDPGEYVLYSEWWEGSDLYKRIDDRQGEGGCPLRQESGSVLMMLPATESAFPDTPSPRPAGQAPSRRHGSARRWVRLGVAVLAAAAMGAVVVIPLAASRTG